MVEAHAPPVDRGLDLVQQGARFSKLADPRDDHAARTGFARTLTGGLLVLAGTFGEVLRARGHDEASVDRWAAEAIDAALAAMTERFL